MKKFFAKIASFFPEILIFISIFCLSFSLTYGISESAKQEARAEVLASENLYLKGEIEWFKAQFKDTSYKTVPTLPDDANAADGGSNE